MSKEEVVFVLTNLQVASGALSALPVRQESGCHSGPFTGFPVDEP